MRLEIELNNLKVMLLIDGNLISNTHKYTIFIIFFIGRDYLIKQIIWQKDVVIYYK